MVAARLKILVAEDDEGWRQLLSFWLGTAGYGVRLTRAGKEALSLARRDPPDCFIIDHDLGDMTGTSVCKAIKSQPMFKKTPVIILTANANAFAGVIADFSPDQFVTKSNEPDELLLTLATLLDAQG